MMIKMIKMMMIMMSMRMMMMIDITGHLRLEMCNCATCGGAFGLRNFSSNLNVQPNAPTTTYSPTAVLQPKVKRTTQCHRLYLNCEVTSPSAPHTNAFTVGVCITKAMKRLLWALLRKTKVQHAWVLFSHHDKSSSYICTYMHMCTYMHLCTYATYWARIVRSQLRKRSNNWEFKIFLPVRDFTKIQNEKLLMKMKKGTGSALIPQSLQTNERW